MLNSILQQAKLANRPVSQYNTIHVSIKTNGINNKSAPSHTQTHTEGEQFKLFLSSYHHHHDSHHIVMEKVMMPMIARIATMKDFSPSWPNVEHPSVEK
jgi:hypothetical protein